MHGYMWCECQKPKIWQIISWTQALKQCTHNICYFDSVACFIRKPFHIPYAPLLFSHCHTDYIWMVRNRLRAELLFQNQSCETCYGCSDCMETHCQCVPRRNAEWFVLLFHYVFRVVCVYCTPKYFLLISVLHV